MLEQKIKTAVICHDAGGAEILSSYIRQKSIKPFFCIDGPAVSIFERKFGTLRVDCLEQVIDQVDRLLCGTSWQSELEWYGIELARTKGKKSIAFLDHWVNYRERFIRNGIEHLPDEIWVGDSYAQIIAEKTFPELQITFVENPSFSDIYDEISIFKRNVRPSSSGLTVLFVSDNLAESMMKQYGNERHWGYTDNDTLEYFLQHLDILNEAVNKIIIRPHPSESVNNYKWVESTKSFSVEIGGEKTLLEEIALSDVVVGAESMAMVIAVIAGKRVISCIPPEGKDCSLPQVEIEKMQNLIEEKNKVVNEVL